MEFKVHSLRVEHKRTYNNRNDDYDENKIFILNCIASNDKKYELSVWTEYGDCCSGWCAASWGHGTLRKVKSFIGMTHKPIHALSFSLDDKMKNCDYFRLRLENNIFKVDCDGGDEWYPCGESNVNMDLFEPIVRAKEKRPVWIFKGESGLGKSYLAGIIENSNRMKTVYETDAHEELTYINEDIVVVGNKYDHSMDEILAKIQGEHEVIFVNFEH